MNVQELADKWFEKAASDLNIASRCLSEADDGMWVNTEPEGACFHSQQAIEKSLKGFLVFYNVAPPKIHDLKVLCEMSMQYEANFEQFLDVCSDITRYAVKSRYPDDVFEINDMIANEAFANAQIIFEFCKEKLKID
jgi:HEPN domain-containing protein